MYRDYARRVGIRPAAILSNNSNTGSSLHPSISLKMNTLGKQSAANSISISFIRIWNKEFTRRMSLYRNDEDERRKEITSEKYSSWFYVMPKGDENITKLDSSRIKHLILIRIEDNVNANIRHLLYVLRGAWEWEREGESSTNICVSGSIWWSHLRQHAIMKKWRQFGVAVMECHLKGSEIKLQHSNVKGVVRWATSYPPIRFPAAPIKVQSKIHGAKRLVLNVNNIRYWTSLESGRMLHTYMCIAVPHSNAMS